MNKNIITELEKLQTIEFAKNNKIGKIKAKIYREAIAKIKGFGKEITHEDQIKHLHGIGKRILLKVHEILETGELQATKWKIDDI